MASIWYTSIQTNFYYLKQTKMKKLLMCLLIAGSFATVASAQIGTKTKTQNMQQVKDYVLMKDGKMHLVKGGNITSLVNDLTLPNGTTISTTGTVKSSEGTTLQLKEGEKIDMDGKILMKTDDMKEGIKKDTI